MSEDPADQRNVLAQQRTTLAEQRTTMAFDRTRFAADRTLMAWMRTAVSLIGLGFSIYKFFQYLSRSGMTDPDWTPSAPRALAIALILLGLAFLLVALIEHVRFMKRLSAAASQRFPVGPSLIAAILLWVVGLLALVAVLFRAGPV
jgi:putative membrane protein